jgi:hypothetical protein
MCWDWLPTPRGNVSVIPQQTTSILLTVEILFRCLKYDWRRQDGSKILTCCERRYLLPETRGQAKTISRFSAGQMLTKGKLNYPGPFTFCETQQLWPLWTWDGPQHINLGVVTLVFLPASPWCKLTHLCHSCFHGHCEYIMEREVGWEPICMSRPSSVSSLGMGLKAQR